MSNQLKEVLKGFEEKKPIQKMSEWGAQMARDVHRHLKVIKAMDEVTRGRECEPHQEHHFIQGSLMMYESTIKSKIDGYSGFYIKKDSMLNSFYIMDCEKYYLKIPYFEIHKFEVITK